MGTDDVHYPVEILLLFSRLSLYLHVPMAPAAGVYLSKAISSGSCDDISISSSRRTPSMPCQPAYMHRVLPGYDPQASITPWRDAFITGEGPPDWATRTFFTNDHRFYYLLLYSLITIVFINLFINLLYFYLPLNHLTTTFTSLSGTPITFTTVLPSIRPALFHSSWRHLICPCCQGRNGPLSCPLPCH